MPSGCFARRPGFTLVETLTLMSESARRVQSSASSKGVLTKPLPYPELDPLMRVFAEAPTEPEFPASVAAALPAWREQSDASAPIAVFWRADLSLGRDRSEPLRGMRVTGGFFIRSGGSERRTSFWEIEKPGSRW
jgi:hypothetical protein